MPLPTKAELSELIVEALYPTSANVLPEVCRRLGLASGDRDEAMSSKRAYVRKRIASIDQNELRRLGVEVNREQPRLDLAEALAKLDEAGQGDLGLIARRRIIKLFDGSYSLAGDLEMNDFIEPVWPVSTMMVLGHLGGTQVSIRGQIEQHVERNSDWSGADLLNRLGAQTCSRSRFFRLLEATVHPLTRGEDDERGELVWHINQHLQPDGWCLEMTSRTSGLPVFTVQPLVPAGEHPADASISEGLAAFDEDSVHAAWRKALDRRAADPQGAITAARTLVETVCKHVLDDAGVPYQEKDDLPKLYKATAQVLHLAPSQHTEEVFKQILGGCTSVVEGLGSLRNRLSDAHGQGRRPARPKRRHAQLVVNLAGAMSVFLVSTWAEKSKGVP